MRNAIGLLCGGLFGAGLLVSGMTQPAKVQGFLDVFGDWDATLAFVLSGALIPMAIAWRIAAHRTSAVTGTPFPGPPATRLDARLILGAVLFGAGWGLSGLCPGPAVASVGFGGLPVLIFVVAMLVGMALVKPLRAALAQSQPVSDRASNAVR